MKVTILMIALVVAAVPTVSLADDFLEAPVLSGGTIVVSREGCLEKVYGQTYEEVVAFYRDALKDQPDLKFRDRGNTMVIEDFGNRPWHSITVSSIDGASVKVAITKDSWSWVLGSLTVRFIGVFAVLAVLYLSMSLSGAIITSFLSRKELGTIRAGQTLSREKA